MRASSSNTGRIFSVTTHRLEALRAAQSAINGNRDTAYGSPEDNFQRIAQLWSMYLRRELAATDVANMMILLKIARSMHSLHDDAWVDIIGYAACGYEIMKTVDDGAPIQNDA